MNAVPAALRLFPAIRLRDIALRDLTPRKVTLANYGPRDHHRWVFEGRLPDAPGPCFFKLWNPTYVRRDNLPAAIDAGFYDDRLVPALHALIVDDAVCRGYVMYAGRTRHGECIDAFREEVYARTQETGWFVSQFSAWHTMRYRAGFSLLDLEAAFPLADLVRMRQWQIGFDDPDYLRFVAALYHRRQSHGTPFGTITPEDYEAGWAEFGHLAVRLRHPVIRRLWMRPRRTLAMKLRNLRPRKDLIQGAGMGPDGG